MSLRLFIMESKVSRAYQRNKLLLNFHVGKNFKAIYPC